MKNIWTTHRQNIFDLFNLIEKLRGDIEILKQEIEGEEDEFEDGEDIEE